MTSPPKRILYGFVTTDLHIAHSLAVCTAPAVTTADPFCSSSHAIVSMIYVNKVRHICRDN